jgi:hypothetical protein
MRTLRARAVGFLAFVFVAILSAHVGQTQSAATPDPRYLTFQIFTAGPGMTTEAGKHVFSKLPDAGFFDDQAKEILDAIGQRGDADHRLGIMIGPLALDYTDSQLRTLIERTFEVASKYHIAVGLHIDDSKFWMNRSDLWGDRANVEWLDWSGTPNTGQYLNWGGGPWKLAPQACLNSPTMVKEARRVAGSVIGPAVAAGLATLRRSGHEALFAGIIVGWETAIARDLDTGAYLGYCAMTNLGYTAKHPPPDFDAALESVVQGWIETWSSSLADSGVPSNRIYSHIAFTSKRQFDEAGGSASNSYARSVLYTPPLVAFGETHSPGFSTYPDADRFNEIYEALKAKGSPHWASAEGTNVDIQAAPPRIPDESMEDYLARMFNHGATLTNVFGWGVGDSANLFRRAAEDADSIAAYRKFLSGAPLKERPLMQSVNGEASVLQGLVRALPSRIQSYLRAGGEVSVIQPRVAELDRNIKAGHFDAIKRNLDEIEATIDAKLGEAGKAGAPAGFDVVAALQQKMRALPQQIDAFQQHNGDMNRIRTQIESIQKRIAAGELGKAYEEVQAIEPILESP